MFTVNILTSQRSLGQGYIFTGVCHSVNRGGLPGGSPKGDPPRQGDPQPRRPPSKETPHKGDPLPGRLPSRETPHQENPPCQEEPPLPPARETPPPGPLPRGKFRGIRSRSTAKGEIEGDQVQVHTQGGN